MMKAKGVENKAMKPAPGKKSAPPPPAPKGKAKGKC